MEAMHQIKKFVQCLLKQENAALRTTTASSHQLVSYIKDGRTVMQWKLQRGKTGSLRRVLHPSSKDIERLVEPMLVCRLSMKHKMPMVLHDEHGRTSYSQKQCIERLREAYKDQMKVFIASGGLRCDCGGRALEDEEDEEDILSRPTRVDWSVADADNDAARGAAAAETPLINTQRYDGPSLWHDPTPSDIVPPIHTNVSPDSKSAMVPVRTGCANLGQSSRVQTTTNPGLHNLLPVNPAVATPPVELVGMLKTTIDALLKARDDKDAMMMHAMSNMQEMYRTDLHARNLKDTMASKMALKEKEMNLIREVKEREYQLKAERQRQLFQAELARAQTNENVMLAEIQRDTFRSQLADKEAHSMGPELVLKLLSQTKPDANNSIECGPALTQDYVFGPDN